MIHGDLKYITSIQKTLADLNQDRTVDASDLNEANILIEGGS